MHARVYIVQYKLTISINFKLPDNVNMIQITGLLQILTPKHYFTVRQYHKIVWGKYKCKEREMWQRD